MRLYMRCVLFDFLFGGALVAGALLVASLLGPDLGGIIAGAPIRTASAVFLQYVHKGLESAVQMTRGVVLAMVSNVFFAIALYVTLPRLGIVGGFLIASTVFVVAVVILNYVVP